MFDNKWRFLGLAVATAGLLQQGCHRCSATPPPSASLNVVYETQLLSEWCWNACAVMAAKTLGHNTNQCQAAQLKFPGSICCPGGVPGQACNIGGWPPFRELGFDSKRTRRKALTYSQLTCEIGVQRRPVAFSWEYLDSQGNRDGVGHMMVAGGYRKPNGVEWIEIYDPLCDESGAGGQPAVCGAEWMLYTRYVSRQNTTGVSYLHWDDFYAIRKQQP